ncbi:MAG: GAP family protein [Thermoleophilia bacterium]|nr:GAP family protein [Thermoleophilia bacterium]
MEKTLLEILPLAIAATFSPSGLLLVTMILSGKDRPVKNSVVFLSGAVLFLISLGSFIMVAYNSAVTSKSRPGSFAGAIDILLGLLIIVVIGRSVIFRKKEKKVEKNRRRNHVHGLVSRAGHIARAWEIRKGDGAGQVFHFQTWYPGGAGILLPYSAIFDLQRGYGDSGRCLLLFMPAGTLK